MSYSEFTLSDIRERLNVTFEEQLSLFSDVPDVEISAFLKQALEENVPLALAISTEKARSEMIITPILIELRKMLNRRISLFSGIEFNVDKNMGLNGICDYIISLSKEQLYLRTPVISVVEAKNEDMKSGIAQCAAEMVAARIFNERQNNKIDSIYGVVTTGSAWKFLKLNEKLYIDFKEYYIDQLGKIMGILVHLIESAFSKMVTP